MQNNVAQSGGGTYACTVIASALSGNSASGIGGGSCYDTLNNCSVTGNSASQGGGVNQGVLTNCTLSGNLAFDSGGGANSSTVINCSFFNNIAVTNGGGAYEGALNNCTVLGNSARAGGGVASASLGNCIVYYNRASNGTNYWAGTLDYCCTLPLPTNGVGNIGDDPQLADPAHLSAASPCIGAGNATYASGVDIDGESWASPPAIGCDEYAAASASGLLSVSIQSDYAHAKTGSALNFTAGIVGHASACSWDFGDGTGLSNRPCPSHAWTSAGDYRVVLSAYNQSYPGGVSATSIVHVLDQPEQYVAQAGTNPVAPFLSWVTAATNIQDALDAAFAGGGTVLVSNGVYRTGGKTITGILTNRVSVTQAMTVQSVNGPEATVIEGWHVPGTVNGDTAVRCVYLADGAALLGFTLTNGATRGNNSGIAEMSGGGAWCQSTNAVLSNCVVVANSCSWWGAGVYSGTLFDCELTSNTNVSGSFGGGGGAAYSQLFGCRLKGNRTSPGSGGGALLCALTDCLVTGNYDVGASRCTLDNCLVTANIGTGVDRGQANNCTISSNTPVYRGSTTYGGGAVQATLSNCVLHANQATNGGAAYNCNLSHCTLSNNWAVRCGGGIYVDASAGYAITDSTLSGNAAGDSGGGFYSLAANRTLVISRCAFSGNAATNNGGGIANAGSFIATIGSCSISNNQAGNNGGGIYFATTTTPTITNCFFVGNSANSSGGGIYFATGNTPAMTNCFFGGNSASGSGGGAYNGNLNQCSFVGNQAVNGGGTRNSTLRNCLLTANTANGGGGAYAGFLYNCTLVR
ncbi:MAG: PKD domain-containing protein, partial [Verrucomicrobia bacterium]|nr:PKD domain-containing protein [Verrucomicrobiota bacterium]